MRKLTMLLAAAAVLTVAVPTPPAYAYGGTIWLSDDYPTDNGQATGWQKAMATALTWWYTH